MTGTLYSFTRLAALLSLTVICSSCVLPESMPVADDGLSVERVLLDPNAHPLPVIHREFLLSGWSNREANVLAHRAMNLPHHGGLPGFEVPFSPAAPSDSALLDPDATPLAILHRAYEKSGWSSREALDHAVRALGLVKDTTQCAVYLVEIIYNQEINGQIMKKVVPGHLNAICWEGRSGTNGLSQSYSAACPPGQARWLMLTVSQLNPCIDLPIGASVWMRVIGESVTVNCDLPRVECDCFEETHGTINFGTIKSECLSLSTT